MSEPLFFPNHSDEQNDIQLWEGLVNAEFSKMEDLLNHQVREGGGKDKLQDQLIWLRYQINYFLESHDLEMLEENFNWVISNFNHDLRLTGPQEFKPMQQLAHP